jgi:hypothetical protein
MQRAETLFPAAASGLTAPSLRALCERHPFRDRLTGRVPPLVCSLLHWYPLYMPALRALLTRILRCNEDKDASTPMLFVAELAS